LLTLAQDKEITVRAKALQALGACTNPRALDVVLPATSEKDYRVRLGAIQGLARNHDQRALDALREMITGYPENRLPWPSAAAAITSLRAAWPKETADILLPLLARKEPNIREVLTHTLATCEDARIPAALMGIYDYQPYGVIGNALVEMGEKAIPDIFAGLVKASSGGIGGSIHRDDREVPPDFRPYIKLLRRIGLPATDYMIAILQQDGDSNRRRRAAFGLGRMEDPRTLPALREAMTDKSGDVRTNAVAALITLHDTSAVQLFVAGLKDADPRVRANCANALRKMQTDTAVPLLIRLLSDPDDDVRYNAAATLSAYQDPRSLEPLLNLLATERDWKAVYAVAGAVAKFKEERGKAQLLDMLDEDEYKYRRAAAAAALGGYHDPQVTERLLGMLDTDDFTIREGVLIGLGLSGDPDIVEKILAVPAKTKLFNDAETVTIALALMAPANVERLLPLLDENSGEAYSALEAFGSVRDPRLVAPALKLLASEDDALTVPAIELLEIQDDPSAIPAIVNAMERFYDSGMRQKDVRESGLHALKKLTGTDLGDETYLWREWWLCGLATPAKN